MIEKASKKSLKFNENIIQNLAESLRKEAETTEEIRKILLKAIGF